MGKCAKIQGMDQSDPSPKLMSLYCHIFLKALKSGSKKIYLVYD